MVYNGILMETIGISVMVSIGLRLFFFSRVVSKADNFYEFKNIQSYSVPLHGCHTLKHSLFATYW